MPQPFSQTYALALTYVGRQDPEGYGRLGFEGALYYAGIVLGDDDPTPEELAEMERQLAEEREAEEKATDDDEIPF